ncbi:MAG: oxidase EvaA [Phenylobacterium sp.]|jgi:oxidase EvaA
MSNNVEFAHVVENYKSDLVAGGFDIDLLRLETQVECLKDWSAFGSIEEVKQWYLDQKEKCTMTITDIPLKECKGWHFCEETGYIRHDSKDFFQVQGVRIGHSEGREVAGGWDQPILTQIGYNGGLLGILRKRFDGVPHYLVDAKAEPGNPDLVQISPALQATFSNLKKAHGGRKPHFAEFFEAPETFGAKVLFNQWMSEDGGRLHLKRNKGMLVEVDDSIELPELPSTFRWVSLFQLKALIKVNSWVNPHIRGIISHL